MSHCTWNRVSWQINSIRNSLGQQQGLPFVDLLTPDMLREVAGQAAESSEPIYTPLVTLWMFLGQVVDPDHSCRQAVARLLVWLTLQGQPACSAETGAYCKARSATVGRASSRFGAAHGSRTARQNANRMALERATRENRRRHHGDYARYRGESGRISSAGWTEAGIGVSHDPAGCTVLFGHRGLVGRGRGGLFWQRNGRIVAVAFDLGASCRRAKCCWPIGCIVPGSRWPC